MKRTSFVLGLMLLLVLPICAGAERCEVIIDGAHYGRDAQGRLVVKGGEPIDGVMMIRTEIEGEPVDRILPRHVAHFGGMFGTIEFTGNGELLPIVDMQDFADGEAKVRIPASVTQLDFNGRESFLLKTNGFEVDSANETFGQKGDCLFRRADGTLLYIVNTEKPWNSMMEALVLPPKIKRIAAHAFDKVNSFDRLVIPEGVEEIEEEALSTIYAEELLLPASLTNVPDDLFCGKVETVTITMGNPVLENCDGFIINRETKTLLYVPYGFEGPLPALEGVTRIGPWAFCETKQLTSLTLPEGITELCEGALNRCYGLKSLHLPSTLTTIGERALPGLSVFQNDNVQTLTVAEGNPRFAVQNGVLLDMESNTARYAFDAKKGSVVIPPRSTRVASDIMGFRTVETVSLPLSVLEIQDGAFEECVSLRHLQLPPTLKHIGKSAFAHCISLEVLQLPAALETIDAWAFYDCSSLREIHFPDNIKAIDMTAFNCVGNPVVYAKEGTVGHRYALSRGMRWAEPGGDPVQLTPTAPEAAALLSAQAILVKPDDTAHVVAECGAGEIVFLGDIKDGWHEVTYGLHTGYLPLDVLEPMNQHTSLVSYTEISAYFWFGIWPDVYSYPCFEATSVDTYDNTVYDVLYTTGAWLLCDMGYDMGYAYYPIYKDVPWCTEDGSDRQYGVVVNEFSDERLNLFEKPDQAAASLGKYFSGTQVEILDSLQEPYEICPDTWYKVEVDGKQGYMLSDFVQTLESGDKEE